VIQENVIDFLIAKFDARIIPVTGRDYIPSQESHIINKNEALVGNGQLVVSSLFTERGSKYFRVGLS
jgi:hypothetical protein